MWSLPPSGGRSKRLVMKWRRPFSSSSLHSVIDDSRGLCHQRVGVLNRPVALRIFHLLFVAIAADAVELQQPVLKAVAGSDLAGPHLVGARVPGDDRLGARPARGGADVEDVRQRLLPRRFREGDGEALAVASALPRPAPPARPPQGPSPATVRGRAGERTQALPSRDCLCSRAVRPRRSCPAYALWRRARRRSARCRSGPGGNLPGGRASPERHPAQARGTCRDRLGEASRSAIPQCRCRRRRARTRRPPHRRPHRGRRRRCGDPRAALPPVRSSRVVGSLRIGPGPGSSPLALTRSVAASSASACPPASPAAGLQPLDRTGKGLGHELVETVEKVERAHDSDEARHPHRLPVLESLDGALRHPGLDRKLPLVEVALKPGSGEPFTELGQGGLIAVLGSYSHNSLLQANYTTISS